MSNSKKETGKTCRISGFRMGLLLLAVAVWLGLVEEASAFLVSQGPFMVRAGRHSVWMTPLSHLLFLTPVGLGFWLLGWKWEELRTRPRVMGFVAAWSVLALGLFMERLHPMAVLILAVGVGTLVSRVARPRPRYRLILPVVAGLGMVLVLGLTLRVELRERQLVEHRTAGAPTPPPWAPNVLLLILDTVRSTSLSFLDDFVPASDYGPVRTPVMEELAEGSVLFTRAIAPSPWTFPSHASMFTGHWPHRMAGGRPLGSGWNETLGTQFPTVAQVLWQYGYATGGFVGNLLFASAASGLNRGFVTYRDYPVSPGQVVLSSGIGRSLAGAGLWRRVLHYYHPINRKSAEVVAHEFLHWQEEQGDRPFFAFLNFFDAHEPYPPPDSVRRALPQGTPWNDFTRNVGLLTGTSAWRTDKWNMGPRERAAHAAGYHEAVLETDEAVGTILQVLEERGTLENTVVIVAGDHGEHLGEHGLYGHGNTLYLPVLHVPLMILDPRREGKGMRVRRVVSLRHMAATILDLVGLSPGRNLIPGSSLARYWEEPDSVPRDRGFSVLTFRDVDEPWYPVTWGPVMYSLVDSTHHYILNGDGTEELYDLEVDPGETENLALFPEHVRVLEGFRETLTTLSSEIPRIRPVPVDHPRPPRPGGR